MLTICDMTLKLARVFNVKRKHNMTYQIIVYATDKLLFEWKVHYYIFVWKPLLYIEVTCALSMSIALLKNVWFWKKGEITFYHVILIQIFLQWEQRFSWRSNRILFWIDSFNALKMYHRDIAN